MIIYIAVTERFVYTAVTIMGPIMYRESIGGQIIVTAWRRKIASLRVQSVVKVG